MPGNSFGEFFRITTFGESHGAGIGVVIDGMPPGFAISEEAIWANLKKRAPGQSSVTTSRQEKDHPRILSGTLNGQTTGTPICILMENEDVRSADYDPAMFRPGHADYTYFKKYGIRDHRGGGRASGRETAARVAAGAVAKILLHHHGIAVFAHTISVGNVHATRFEQSAIEMNPIRCADPEAAMAMVRAIEKAASKRDSLGGIVEIIAEGVPPGLGDPVFNKLDALMAMALMSIPAVKGVEIGAGFKVAAMRGSENNDPLTTNGFLANNAGGILGGISNGEKIIARIAVKPTPSISLKQQTRRQSGEPAEIRISGRHDPCICPRIVPVAESMVAIVLADRWLAQNAIR